MDIRARWAAYSADEAMVALWIHNFRRGWLFTNGAGAGYEQPHIEIRPDPAPEPSETLDKSEMAFLCLMFHSDGEDFAYDEPGHSQSEVEAIADKRIRQSKLLAPFAGQPRLHDHFLLNFWRGYHHILSNDADYEQSVVDGEEQF